MLICLDPGHGGYDPGASGNNLRECDITLDIVLKLKPLLEYNGINVVLTRDGDYAPGHLENNLNGELQARCDIANNANVDLFLSVHINSAVSTANGEEVLIIDTGGNAEKFANILLPQLIKATGFYNRQVNVQNVMVLRNTNMPAVLSENGFISNVEDAKNLSNPNFRQNIAVAHAKSVCTHFRIIYKEPSSQPSTTPQPQPQPSRGATPSTTPSSSSDFSYPNNANVINDDLYIRDVDGNKISGRYVSNGDNITVLDISGSKQLCLVEYPTPSGVKSGYVLNVVNCIRYYYQNQWVNGSSTEAVLDEFGANIGSLNPRESATPLYRKNGKLHVVYATIKGANTKSGYVVWDGGFKKF
jgi:hypothetical protein